jgi:pyruvate formate lyase activating enzyme
MAGTVTSATAPVIPETVPGLVARTLATSFVDGPGNRFVVFTQGCNLDCLNCHNPQTIPCNGRGAGVRVRTVGSLVAEIADASAFLSGVTVSGGEPTLQLNFLAALLESLGGHPRLRQLTRFVDSNGTLHAAGWDRLAPLMDAAMIDVKAVSPALHRHITGVGNAAVLATVRQLYELGKLHEIRLLVLPGLTDEPDELARYAAFVAGIDPSLRLRLMAFRHHGVRRTGQAIPEADADTMAGVLATLRDAGLTGVVPAPVIGG